MACAAPASLGLPRSRCIAFAGATGVRRGWAVPGLWLRSGGDLAADCLLYQLCLSHPGGVQLRAEVATELFTDELRPRLGGQLSACTSAAVSRARRDQSVGVVDRASGTGRWR